MRNRTIWLGLLALLCCTGCIGQREQQLGGEFWFEGTGLVLQLPGNWQSVAVPGSQWPLLATEIDYGIRPNIRLLKYTISPLQRGDVEAFLDQERRTDPDYRVVAERAVTVPGFDSGVKFKATRMNTDNIPIVHLSYILIGEQASCILYATCAEPSLVRLEPIFDTIIGSAKIRY